MFCAKFSWRNLWGIWNKSENYMQTLKNLLNFVIYFDAFINEFGLCIALMVMFLYAILSRQSHRNCFQKELLEQFRLISRDSHQIVLHIWSKLSELLTAISSEIIRKPMVFWYFQGEKKSNNSLKFAEYSKRTLVTVTCQDRNSVRDSVS